MSVEGFPIDLNSNVSPEEAVGSSSLEQAEGVLSQLFRDKESYTIRDLSELQDLDISVITTGVKLDEKSQLYHVLQSIHYIIDEIFLSKVKQIEDTFFEMDPNELETLTPEVRVKLAKIFFEQNPPKKMLHLFSLLFVGKKEDSLLFLDQLGREIDVLKAASIKDVSGRSLIDYSFEKPESYSFGSYLLSGGQFSFRLSTVLHYFEERGVDLEQRMRAVVETIQENDLYLQNLSNEDVFSIVDLLIKAPHDEWKREFFRRIEKNDRFVDIVCGLIDKDYDWLFEITKYCVFTPELSDQIGEYVADQFGRDHPFHAFIKELVDRLLNKKEFETLLVDIQKHKDLKILFKLKDVSNYSLFDYLCGFPNKAIKKFFITKQAAFHIPISAKTKIELDFYFKLYVTRDNIDVEILDALLEMGCLPAYTKDGSCLFLLTSPEARQAYFRRLEAKNPLWDVEISVTNGVSGQEYIMRLLQECDQLSREYVQHIGIVSLEESRLEKQRIQEVFLKMEQCGFSKVKYFEKELESIEFSFLEIDTIVSFFALDKIKTKEVKGGYYSYEASVLLKKGLEKAYNALSLSFGKVNSEYTFIHNRLIQALDFCIAWDEKKGDGPAAIVDAVANLAVGSLILIPLEVEKHTVYLSVEKTSEDEVCLNLFNTGFGLDHFHPFYQQKGESDRYQTFQTIDHISLSSLLNKAPWEKLLEAQKKTISHLYHRFDLLGQEKKESAASEETFEGPFLFSREIITPEITLSNVSPSSQNPINYQRPQKKGSCTVQGLIAFVRKELMSLSKAVYNVVTARAIVAIIEPHVNAVDQEIVKIAQNQFANLQRELALFKEDIERLEQYREVAIDVLQEMDAEEMVNNLKHGYKDDSQLFSFLRTSRNMILMFAKNHAQKYAKIIEDRDLHSLLMLQAFLF